MERVMMWLAAVVILALFAHCGATTSQVLGEIKTGGKIVVRDCGPSGLKTYDDVRNAIHVGGENWVAVVLDAFNCVESVVEDERRAHGCAAAITVACSDAAAIAPDEENRMRAAIALARAAQSVRLGRP